MGAMDFEEPLRLDEVERQAFCEIDPERHYAISKEQFANAIATACNHISHQAPLRFSSSARA